MLAPYTAQGKGIYKCPADKLLSPAQTARGFLERVRSVSLNFYIGPSTDSAASSQSSYGNAYKFFYKFSIFTNFRQPPVLCHLPESYLQY